MIRLWQSKQLISGRSDIDDKIHWQSPSVPAPTIEIVNQSSYISVAVLNTEDVLGLNRQKNRWKNSRISLAIKFAATSIYNWLVCCGTDSGQLYLRLP